MVIRIISKLEYMRGEGLLVFRRATILGGILVKDRVGVAGHEFVGVDSYECGFANAGVDGVREESFSHTRDNGVVREGREGGEIIHSFKPLMMDC